MNFSNIRKHISNSGTEIALSIANPLFGTIRIFIFTRIFESEILAGISIVLSSLSLFSSLSLGGIPQLHFLHSVKTKNAILDLFSLLVSVVTSLIGLCALWISTDNEIISFWFILTLILNEIFVIISSGLLGKGDVKKNKLYDLCRNSIFIFLAFLLVSLGFNVSKEEILILYGAVIVVILVGEYLSGGFKIQKTFAIREIVEDGIKLLPVFASVWVFGYILRLFSFTNLNSDAYNSLSIGLTYYDNIYVLLISVASVYLPKYYSGEINVKLSFMIITVCSFGLLILSVVAYFIVVPFLTDGKYLLNGTENVIYAISLIMKLACYIQFQKLMKSRIFQPIFYFFITSFLFEMLIIFSIKNINTLEYIIIYTITYLIYSVSLYIYERTNSSY